MGFRADSRARNFLDVLEGLGFADLSFLSGAQYPNSLWPRGRDLLWSAAGLRSGDLDNLDITVRRSGCFPSRDQNGHRVFPRGQILRHHGRSVPIDVLGVSIDFRNGGRFAIDDHPGDAAVRSVFQDEFDAGTGDFLSGRLSCRVGIPEPATGGTPAFPSGAERGERDGFLGKRFGHPLRNHEPGISRDRFGFFLGTFRVQDGGDFIQGETGAVRRF